jgi:hypothetical protein
MIAAVGEHVSSSPNRAAILAAVLGDLVCISHRRARIGVTEAILSSRHRNALAYAYFQLVIMICL